MTAVRSLLVALLLGWAFAAVAEVPVPPLTGRVVDLTGTLTSSEISSLTRKLEDFETRKGSQIAVLMVPTTQPETIEQFSIRVADAWKVGRKKIDDGAILIIAKNDRRLRIEVGYGLEGSLTDATTRRIIDEDITPKFVNGDFFGGISAGVDRMVQVIEGEQLPPPQPQHWQNPLSPDNVDVPILIFLVVVVGGILRAILGRLVGSAATGVLVGVLAWMIAGSVALSVILGLMAFGLAFIVGAFAMPGGGGYASRGGGWGGGSSGGSGGGGFSGGGGSFGGGGSSGKW